MSYNICMPPVVVHDAKQAFCSMHNPYSLSRSSSNVLFCPTTQLLCEHCSSTEAAHLSEAGNGAILHALYLFWCAVTPQNAVPVRVAAFTSDDVSMCPCKDVFVPCCCRIGAPDKHWMLISFQKLAIVPSAMPCASSGVLSLPRMLFLCGKRPHLKITSLCSLAYFPLSCAAAANGSPPSGNDRASASSPAKCWIPACIKHLSMSTVLIHCSAATAQQACKQRSLSHNCNLGHEIFLSGRTHIEVEVLGLSSMEQVHLQICCCNTADTGTEGAFRDMQADGTS